MFYISGTLCKGIKMTVEYRQKIDSMFSAGLGSPSSWVCVAALENGLESGQGSLQPWRPLQIHLPTLRPRTLGALGKCCHRNGYGNDNYRPRNYRIRAMIMVHCLTEFKAWAWSLRRDFRLIQIHWLAANPA